MTANDNNRSRFTSQLTLACYTFVYLRYLRDGSLMLALFALLIVSLSGFIGSLTLAYLRRNQDSVTPPTVIEDEDDEVMEILGNAAVKAILLKGLRYFQVIILIQTIYSSVYHFSLKSDDTFCQQRFGFSTLQLIGELDCDKHGKWFLWFLDLLITLFELTLITNSLTLEFQNKKIILPQLQIHKYGILSLLRVDLWSDDLVDSGPDLCISLNRHAGNTNYGSTTLVAQGDGDEQSDRNNGANYEDEENVSLLP